MPTWVFPSFKGPSIFIGSPNDVWQYRTVVFDELETLLADEADAGGLRPYRWELEPDHFLDGPWEAGIPLAEGENCRAAIFLFGERIGSELPSDFGDEWIRDTPAFDRHAKYALDRAGGAPERSFPLTGSTFEYLVARRSGVDLLVLFIGEHWLRLPDSSEVSPQLLALRNFQAYVTDGGSRRLRVACTERETKEVIRGFARERLGLRGGAASAELPFRYLDAYGIGDNDVFFGRDALRDAVILAINQRIARNVTEEPPVVGIIGETGSGKSSLLRAGLLGGLIRRGNWIPCVIRPGDLATTDDALPSLFEQCVHAINSDQEPGPAMRLLKEEPENRPALALSGILAALDALARQTNLREPWRLVIGIDQLEECLDDLGDSGRASRWLNLIEFLERATRTGRIAAAYTIPTARVPEMDGCAPLRRLTANGRRRSIGFPEDVERILDGAFGAVKLTLAADLRTRLLNRISDLTDPVSYQDQGGLLPLLSMAMSHMHEQWQQLESRRPPLDLGREKAEKRRELSLSDHGETAELSTLLNREADAAYDEARRRSGTPSSDDEIVGMLLRPLVRIRTAGDFDLLTIAAPADPTLRVFTEVLRERRILTQDRQGRIRLVHAEVLRSWKRAAKWTEAERRRLEYVARIEGTMNLWFRNGCRAADVPAFGADALELAPEVLYVWAGTLVPADRSEPVSERHRRLLQFLVAILEYRGTPGERIGTLDSSPTHLHAAVAVDATALVGRFLAADPQNARLVRLKDQRTALFDAAFADRDGVLRMLLRAGAAANEPDAEGWLPLHAAAARGRTRALETLLEQTDADAPGHRGTTALMLASGSGNVTTVRALIDRNAAVDMRNEENWTPLLMAAAGGHVAVTRLLLREDVHAAMLPGAWTPLHVAAQRGHAGVVSAIVAHDPGVIDARLDNDGTPLHLAAMHGRESVVKVLIEAGADVGALAQNEWTLSGQPESSREAGTSSWTPIHIAADNGHATIVEQLLDAGALPGARNDAGRTALHIAAGKNRGAVVRVLARRDREGIDARDNRKRTPLHQALENGNYAVAHALCVYGADCNAPQADDHAPLHVAVCNRDEGLVRFLLRHSADIGARDARRVTPLHFAARTGPPALVALLLSGGADLEARDVDRLTPLHYASVHGRAAVVEMLLDCGADATAVNVRGWTALHLAVESGSEAVVQLLLGRGVSPGVVAGERATTPLHVAVELGVRSVVRALLEHGADPRVETSSGVTPFILALRSERLGIALDLLDNGALEGREAMNLAEDLETEWPRQAGSRSDVGEEEELVARFHGMGIRLPDRSEALRSERELQAAAHRIAGAARSASEALRGEQFGTIAQYPWKPVGEAEHSLWAGRLPAKSISERALITSRSEIASCSLPWYPGAVLLRVTDETWKVPRLRLYFLVAGDDIYQLSGQSAPVHEVNARVPIALNVSNVLDYLRFFCYFVRGAEGPFYVIDDAEDPSLPDHPVIRETVRRILRAPRLEGRRSDGRYQCSAVVYYARAAFVADFAVGGDGSVEMLDDEPTANQLPAAIDEPLT